MLANTRWNETHSTGYGGESLLDPLFAHSNLPQEHAERAYSVDSFFFTYLILEIPFEVASGLLFSVLLFAVNLQRTVSMYFLTTLVSFCIVNCGESLGIIFNTLIIDSTGLTFNITMSLILIALTMSGQCPPRSSPNLAPEMSNL